MNLNCKSACESLRRLFCEMHRFVWTLWIVAATTAVTPSWAQAQSQSASPAASVVQVGAYVYQVPDFSYKHENFDVEFALWFRWTDPQLKPHQTFKVRQSTIKSQRLVHEGKVPGSNEYYALVEISAQVHTQWDVSRFPFDRQTLLLAIEDTWHSADELRYEVDKAHMSADYPIRAPGWKVTGIKAQVDRLNFPTNFGYPDPHSPVGTSSSEFRLSMDVIRPHKFQGMKYLVPPLVGILIILGLTLRAGEATWRLVLISPAIFAIVSSDYVIGATLPESSEWSLAERLVILGLCQGAVLTASLLWCIREQPIRPERALRIERWGHWGVWGTLALFAIHVAIEMAW